MFSSFLTFLKNAIHAETHGGKSVWSANGLYVNRSRKYSKIIKDLVGNGKLLRQRAETRKMLCLDGSCYILFEALDAVKYFTV